MNFATRSAGTITSFVAAKTSGLLRRSRKMLAAMLMCSSSLAFAGITVGPTSGLFGNVIVGNFNTVGFTISNGSASAATLNTISYGSSTTFYESIFNFDPVPCVPTLVLAPGDSCTYYVNFQPATSGPDSALLTVTFDVQTLMIPLSGTGGTKVASVSPTAANFPDTPVGNTATPINLTVTNDGTFNITFVTPWPGFLDVSQFTDFTLGGSCVGATIVPAGTCTVQVDFHPTYVGSHFYNIKNFLSMASGALFTDATIQASGNGLAVAPGFTTGPVYPQATKDATYSTAILSTGTPTITWSITAGSLPPGLSLDGMTGVISGAPTAIGNYMFTLQATNGTTPDATQNASISVVLPSISFTPNTGLNFGPQVVGVASSTLSAIVTNASPLTLTPSSISFIGGGAGFNVLGSSTCLSVGSLAPNDTCAIDVNVTPTGLGSLNDSIIVPTSPASNSFPSALPLFVTGISATASVTPAAATFGNVDIGAAPQQTFTIYGGAGLSALTIAVTGSSRVTVPGGQNNCGTTLAAGVSCTFDIKFNPNAVGAISATSVTVSSSAGTLATITVTGSGQQPPTTVAAGPAFGGVTVGASASQTLTFTNNSTVSLTVSALNVPGAAFSAAGSGATPCTVSLVVAPAGTCTFDVTFTPTSVTGFSSAVNVGYTSNSSSFTQNAAGGATGNGTAPATSFSPASVTHPSTTVSQSNVVPVTFNNNSSVSITLTAAAISSTNSAEYVLSGTGATPCANNLVVPAGTGCTMNSTFTPSTTSSPGSTYAIAFTSGAASFSKNAAANGTGVAPTTSFSPASLSHGSVPLNSPNAVTGTFTNTSAVGITLGASALSSVNGQYTITGSGGTPCANNLPIAPGASCTFTSTFTPTVTAPVGNTFNIAFGAGSQSFTASVTASGTGVTPIAPTVAPTSVLFGNVPVTVPVTQTVTLSNSNIFGIKLTALSNSDARFTVAGSGASPCNVGVTVAAGGTCTYDLTFTPAGTGSYNNTLTITYQPAGAGPTLTISPTANGTGFNPPFTISPTSFAFGSVALGSLNTTSFTFTNNSNTTAFPSSYTLTAISAPGLGFSAAGSGGTPCTIGLALPAGASCGMTVTFQVISGSTGSYNSTTTISFQAGLGSNPTYSGSFSAGGIIFFVAPTITSAAPATPAALGSAYTHTFTASGSQPLTWSIATGTLPPGLSLNGITGVLSGTPNTLGTYSFTVQTANGQLPNGTQAVSITVISPTVVVNTADSGVGSLRNAILSANSSCGAGQTITFNIPGTGPFTIAPAAGNSLPGLTCANLVIDGYSQPGASVNTGGISNNNANLQIIVDGSNGGVSCFQVGAGNITIKGLAIRSCQYEAIYITGNNAQILGNYIGTDPGGMTAFGNGAAGVKVDGNATGVAIGNGSNAGVNLVTGNTFAGVQIANASGVTVNSNMIGGDRSGGSAIASGGHGVECFGNCGNSTIVANYIHHHSGSGVFVTANATGMNYPNNGIDISQNHIFATGAKGIDTNTGNSGIQKPVLLQVTHDALGNTSVGGTFTALGAGSYSVELFDNSAPNVPSVPSGYAYASGTNVTATGAGATNLSTSAAGFLHNLSVTVTRSSSGDTSEFNALYLTPVSIGSPPTTYNVAVGAASLYQTITLTNISGASLPAGAIVTTTSGTGFTVANDNCNSQAVANGATCTVDVGYSAASAGTTPGQAQIMVTQNGVATAFQSALSGVATAGSLSLSTASLNFGNVQLGGSATPLVVTVTNTGAVNLIVSGVSLVAAGVAPSVADYSVNPNPCPAPIAPAGTCQITVGFTPTGTGPRTAQLNILSNAVTSPDVVALTGTGFTPTATLTPNPLAFGNQVYGVVSAPLTATFTNTSPIALTTTNFALGSGFNIAGTGTCTVNGVVAPGATCTVDVTATPPAIGGFGTSLTINTSPTSNNPSIGVSVTGVGIAPVITSGAPQAGTATVAYSFTFTATGTPAPTWSVITGALPLGLSLSTAGVLSGTPTGAGTFNFTVQASNGTLPDAPQMVSLVIAPPPSPLTATLAFSPTTVGVNGITTLTITLNNTGGTSVGPGSLNLPYASGGLNIGLDNAANPNATTNCPGGAGFAVGAFTTFLTYNPAGFIMPAGTSCTISVQVTPVQLNNMTLTVNPGAFLMSGVNGNANTASATLTVVPAAGISLSSNTATFGNQLVGTTSGTQGITIQNIGSAAATLTLPFTTSGDFAVSGTTCTATLAIGATCAANITFTPTAAGTRTGTLSITSNAPGSPHVVNLSGIGAVPPTLSFAPATAVAGSQVLLGVSVTNTAGNPAFAGMGVTLNYPAGFTNVAAAGGFPQAGCSATVTGYAAGTTVLSAGAGFIGSVGSGSITCSMMLAQVTVPSSPGIYTFTIPAGGFTSTGPVAYSNPAPINFTLTVTAAPPTAALTLTPASIVAGAPSALKFTFTNGTNAPATATAFTLVYPANVITAASPPPATTCGGLLTGVNATQAAATGMTIPALGACTVTVNVTSNTPGNYNLTLPVGALTSSNGANTAAASATLTVTSPNAPAITFAPNGLNLGAQAVGGTSAAQTVTVTNSGNAALVISSITLAGDFAFSTNCPLTPSSVAVGASCTIDVDFSPLTQGVQNSAVVVVSNATNGTTQSVPVTGNGTPQLVPTLAFAPSTLAFGNQAVGSSGAAQSVILTNSGQATLAFTSITVSGSGFLRVSSPASGVLVPSCGATLAPAASCHVSVVLAPLATGAQNGSIVIVHNAAGSPGTVILTGNGTPRPQPLISVPASITFGNQIIGTQSVTQAVNIANTGTATMAISGITLSGTNASQFSVTGNCVTTLTAGSNCSLLARFSPTALGAQSAQLTIVSDAANTPTATVALSGNGVPVPAPVVRLSATLLGFGNVIYGSFATQGVTLSNIGTAPLLIQSVTETGNADFTVASACGTSVAAGGQCNLGIAFTPRAIGARSGVVSVTSNAAGSPHKIQMGGTGCRYFSPAAARFFLTSC